MDKVKICYKIHIFFNGLSYLFLFLACISIFIQTIDNLIYNYSNDKTILAEKLVYQQFSHDVYSNINNKILYQFETVPYGHDCPEGKEVLKIPIKIDTFYDCEDIKYNVEDLDEEVCKNSISKGATCCQKECCKNNIYVKQQQCREKNFFNKSEEENDPRKNVCKYYNIYNGKFSQIFNSIICVKRYEYNYDYLLYKNENNSCVNNTICRYFDTKSHCICDQNLKDNYNINVLLNGKNIYLNQGFFIVKNIFSEINPNYFEYESLIKESLFNNKIKIDPKKEKEVSNYKVINIKNIYNAFFKDYNISDRGNLNYNNHRDILLDNIIKNNEEYIFKDYKENMYIKNKSISWYSRGYIGFKNSEELKKFKYYFNENDPTNNPLYKIADIIYPNRESIIIIFLFFVFVLILIISQIKFFIKTNNKINQLLFCDYLRQISSLALFIIYLFMYLFKYIYCFRELEIDMEIYYLYVLKKYNERRKQIYLLYAVFFLSFNFILEIINFLIMIFFQINKGNNPSSKYSIICKLENSYNGTIHNFKFYLKRKFRDEMERFKKKFFENFDIEQCKTNGKIIDVDKTLREIRLKSDSIIQVICEPKD